MNMDKVSESCENGDGFNKKERHEVMTMVCNKNENLPKNRLLYLFIQCVWDPRLGPCYDEHKYKKLETWLETAEFIDNLVDGKYIIFRNSEGSSFCTLRKPVSIISYADFQRKTQDSRDMIILTHITYHLRGIIDLLILEKGDVNRMNKAGQTLLPAYLCQCRDVSVDAPEDEVSIIRKVIKVLIEIGAPLYAGNWRRETPFRLATKCKNRQILHSVVSNLTDIEAHDEFGNTALHIVVNNCVDKEGNHKDGYVDFVRILVSKGANLNTKNNDGLTPIHLAVEKFQTDMLQLFASEGANFNERTQDDQAPLHIVCKSTLKLNDSSKPTETFDFLVTKGCDVEAMDKEGHKPMHFAAEFRCIDIVEKLIALGVSIDSRTEKTLLTPLYLAAKGDKLDNMKALVRAGADVNAEAADGTTPIFMSAMVGSYESMQFLMDQGADLHRRDSLTGLTLLHLAANGEELRAGFKAEDEAQAERKLKKLKMLIDKGLDVNDTGVCGVAPLQLAILAPNLDAVKLLLDRGANVNFQNQWTALELAVKIRDYGNVCTGIRRFSGTRVTIWRNALGSRRRYNVGVYSDDVKKDDVRLSCPIKKLWSHERRRMTVRYLEILSLLVDYGADVNVANPKGKTPLHLVRRHNDGAIRKLLNAGAHVNVQDNKGRLPVHGIREGISLKLLLDFGADINDDDTSQKLMSNMKEFKNVVIEHIVKRKLVGLPIAKAYESLIDAPEFADVHEKCSKEATNLISHREDDGFSLYEFLRMNPKLQYHYIDKISRNYKNLEQVFPMYAGMIRGACRESAIRRQLLESARVVWVENTDVDLPGVCIEHILSNLSNRYLKVMTTTMKNVKNTSVPDKNVVFKYEFSNCCFDFA